MSSSSISGKSESTFNQDNSIKKVVSNSSLKVEDTENGETSQLMLADKPSDSSINHQPAVTDENNTVQSAEHLIEATVSNLEREILLRGDSAEKRAKFLQLPSTSRPNSPSHYEREVVGDDRAQNRVHVLCECEQPTVAGAAVPIVTSFIAPNVMATSKKEIAHKPRPSLIPKLTTTFKSEKSGKPDSDPAKQGRNICFSDSSNKVKRDSVEQASLDEEVQKVKRYRQLTKEFTKYVSRLAEETTNLTNEVNSPESQASAVDELYRHIINLRKVTTELKTLQSTRAVSEPQISKVQEDVLTPTDAMDSTIKSKNKDNNKIYIKFLPTKSTVKNKKSCNSEVQTNLESSLEPKEVDSMDGVFIPSADGPPTSEDDDEVDDEGLDITITFPELQKTFDQDDSHLSVCFSDLSAEALGRLKRCPKEFTLRMDFVQGKMFFQSARSNANNYSIGPDMKIIECNMDFKKSDLISIKPSTECLYTSQIIPVEGASTKESIKLLKSTDSELFNVVSLPYMNRKSYSATQSCFTFRNIRKKLSGESMLADRFYYKSMPQIPSLTRILEEPSKEYSFCPIRHEKRTRVRGLQRKRTATSLEHIL